MEEVTQQRLSAISGQADACFVGNIYRKKTQTMGIIAL